MPSAAQIGFSCLLLICGLAQLAGCRKESATPDSTSSAGPAAQPTSKPAPQELDVAAAADLQFAMDQLKSEFEKSHPEIDLKITYGSSGNFYTQITSRAPFDLFFSADASYPRKLLDGGLAVKDSEFTYAIGRIVLWAPKGSKFEPATRKMKALLDPSFQKLAIANPQHAPYGRAAEAALKKYQLWDKLQPKLVQGENIAQAAQFAQSGSVDAGIIALSLASSPQMKSAGTYFLIPPEDYPQLDQVAVILSGAKNAAGAREFIQFIRSPQGTAILKQYGFEIPTK